MQKYAFLPMWLGMMLVFHTLDLIFGIEITESNTNSEKIYVIIVCCYLCLYWKLEERD